MSEQVYQQVERAMREKLHLLADRTILGSACWDYPIAIELGNIVLRDSDCGLAKPTKTITTEEWERRARGGLWAKTGFWSFVPADEPAVSEIRWCEYDPKSAGRELHRLKVLVREYEAHRPAE